MSGSYTQSLFDKAFQSLARKLMRRICFPADVSNDALATPGASAYLVHGVAEGVAGGEPAAHHGSAVGSHNHAMKRPARGGEIERGGAHLRLELS